MKLINFENDKIFITALTALVAAGLGITLKACQKDQKFEDESNRQIGISIASPESRKLEVKPTR